MAKKPEQQPRRLPARGGKRRIARQQRFRVAMGNLHQPRKLIRVFPSIKQPGAGQAGLARAQSITTAAGFQILLGDNETVFGVAQHQKAPSFAITQAWGMDQQAGRSLPPRPTRPRS